MFPQLFSGGGYLSGVVVLTLPDIARLAAVVHSLRYFPRDSEEVRLPFTIFFHEPMGFFQ
jgi:hypothetical protein